MPKLPLGHSPAARENWCLAVNVDELYRLGTWFTAQFKELNRRYTAVLEPINHNASQPDALVEGFADVVQTTSVMREMRARADIL